MVVAVLDPYLVTSNTPQAIPPATEQQTGQGSVASLVLGILGLLTSWILVGIVLGAIAVSMGRRRDPLSGLSRAGVALGWIAISLGLLLAVIRGIAAASS